MNLYTRIEVVNCEEATEVSEGKRRPRKTKDGRQVYRVGAKVEEGDGQRVLELNSLVELEVGSTVEVRVEVFAFNDKAGRPILRFRIAEVA
jgi:hypothetical protein